MTKDDLLGRVCETIAAYSAIGNERFEAHGATFVRNRSTPRRYDANHVDRIRTTKADEIEALLLHAENEFASFGHRRFDIDALTPPRIAARLALNGGFSYISEGLHLLLEGEVKAVARPIEIREILTEAGWQAYERLLRMDLTEDAEKHGHTPDLSTAPEWVTYVRAKSPAVRFWLAYVDDLAVAFFNSWPGDNGVGQVEDLFTHPAYRHRGIATALITHCVADARARGAGPVVITADPDDTPKQMYASMGFRPLYVTRSYTKILTVEDDVGSSTARS